jgi:hypothetical protein
VRKSLVAKPLQHDGGFCFSVFQTLSRIVQAGHDSSTRRTLATKPVRRGRREFSRAPNQPNLRQIAVSEKVIVIVVSLKLDTFGLDFHFDIELLDHCFDVVSSAPGALAPPFRTEKRETSGRHHRFCAH